MYNLNFRFKLYITEFFSDETISLYNAIKFALYKLRVIDVVQISPCTQFHQFNPLIYVLIKIAAKIQETKTSLHLDNWFYGIEN